MKTLVFFVLALFAFNSLIAGNNSKKSDKNRENSATVSFSGVVTDENTGELLTGVEVKIEGANLKTYTDFDGKFTFREIKPGNFNLVASYISYNKAGLKVIKVDESEKIMIKMHTAKQVKSKFFSFSQNYFIEND